MRLEPHFIAQIRETVRAQAGSGCIVRIFGSRVLDEVRGGDVDVLLELSYSPPNAALLAAEVSAGLSRVLQGRKVDVLILAPGLARLPIHELALREGVVL